MAKKLTTLREVCEELAEERKITLTPFSPLSSPKGIVFYRFLNRNYLQNEYLVKNELLLKSNGLEGFGGLLYLLYFGLNVDDSRLKKEFLLAEDSERLTVTTDFRMKVIDLKVKNALFALRKVTPWGVQFDEVPMSEYRFGGEYNLYNGAKVFLDSLLGNHKKEKKD